MSPLIFSTRRPSGCSAHSSSSSGLSARMMTWEGSDCSSGRSEATLALIRSTVSSPTKTAGTHFVALASSRDMVSRFRAVSEGPLNTSSMTIHSPSTRVAATARRAISPRRRYRRTRPPFFPVSGAARFPVRSSSMSILPFFSLSRKDPPALDHIARHKQDGHHPGVHHCPQEGLPVADPGGPEHPLGQQELTQQQR